MFDNFCVYLDAGHGALDHQGRYVTAPSKQHEHPKGTFHNGRWFYEGVWNRKLTNLVAEKLRGLKIDCLPLYHEYVDLSLEYRVAKANWYYVHYKKGILISNHANAADTRARGFEVYTTPGQTKSDTLADIHYSNVSDMLGSRISLRPDKSDSDYDKEARFYIIHKTVMPAMLVEHLFFDNYDDATLLMSDEIVELFAEAQVRSIIEYFEKE